MSHKKYSVALMILFVVTGFLLIKTAGYLELHNHPLLSSLTCLETENRKGIYWTVNQVGIAEALRTDEGSLVIRLKNTIPNFTGYLYRTGAGETWQRLEGDQLVLDIKEGQVILEVQGITLSGVNPNPAAFSITVRDDGVMVDSDGPEIIEEQFGFTFENVNSPKVRWLRGLTLPVVNSLEGQWNRFTALRAWVKEQIPYRDPVMKSEWDAQKILRAVWDDTSVGFICDAFAATYVSSCLSVGLNARMIHLGDDRDFGHYAAEVWSDDYQKWVFMDPLYNCHFTLDGLPLSAAELHDLWKRGELGKLEKWGDNPEKPEHDLNPIDYFNLLKDIQVINGNNFLSAPYRSFLDLVTHKIRYVRWVNEMNPPYDRTDLACKIVTFYYLPKALRLFILPVVLPGLLLFFSVRAFRHKGS